MGTETEKRKVKHIFKKAGIKGKAIEGYLKP
jgi:hypothetical protein